MPWATWISTPPPERKSGAAATMSSPAEPLPSQVTRISRNPAATTGLDADGGGWSSTAVSIATTSDHGPWLPELSTAATRTPSARPPSMLPKVSEFWVVGELSGVSQKPSLVPGCSGSKIDTPTFCTPRYWYCTT